MTKVFSCTATKDWDRNIVHNIHYKIAPIDCSVTVMQQEQSVNLSSLIGLLKLQIKENDILKIAVEANEKQDILEIKKYFEEIVRIRQEES